MALPSRRDLIRALLEGGVRLSYRDVRERELLRQRVLGAARVAGVVVWTRARGERGVLEAKALRDACPEAPPRWPQPHPYRPADARAPCSRAFVEGGFSERALLGDVAAAAELAARVRHELEKAGFPGSGPGTEGEGGARLRRPGVARATGNPSPAGEVGRWS